MSVYARDLLERVVATFAAGVLSVLGGDLVNVFDADWGTALGVGVGAAVLSLLKGVAAKGLGDRGSASALPSVQNSGRHRPTG